MGSLASSSSVSQALGSAALVVPLQQEGGFASSGWSRDERQGRSRGRQGGEQGVATHEGKRRSRRAQPRLQGSQGVRGRRKWLGFIRRYLRHDRPAPLVGMLGRHRSTETSRLTMPGPSVTLPLRQWDCATSTSTLTASVTLVNPFSR